MGSLDRLFKDAESRLEDMIYARLDHEIDTYELYEQSMNVKKEIEKHENHMEGYNRYPKVYDMIFFLYQLHDLHTRVNLDNRQLIDLLGDNTYRESPSADA